MIKSIKELHFNKAMQKMIHNTEVNFSEQAKIEKSELTMLDWINANIASVEKEEQNTFEDLTDREKFLFSFALLSILMQDN